MLKVRLALMNFLEFAVWGAYLTCMGMYLGRIGMADHIGSFYAMQGFVSIFMPAVVAIWVILESPPKLDGSIPCKVSCRYLCPL